MSQLPLLFRDIFQKASSDFGHRFSFRTGFCGLLISNLFFHASLAGSTPPLPLACANTYHYKPSSIRIDGSIDYEETKFPVSFVDPGSEYHRYRDRKWKQDEDRLLKKSEKSGDFRDLSDYAVALMHNGKKAEALQIFESLIAGNPNEYPIASNLGTAYELNGNNQKALDWISRAVELHEESHEGTEWLHIQILKAKIALESDPDWLEKNAILELDFGKRSKPVLPANLRENPEELKRVTKALRYQLKERVQFVKPDDQIVSRLLFDLSNLVAHSHNVGDALKLAELAQKYAGKKETRYNKLLQKRREFYFVRTDDSFSSTIKRNRTVLFILGGCILGILAIPMKFFLDDAREAREE